MGFMYPELAGTHATHGPTPYYSYGFLQIISRIPQAKYHIETIFSIIWFMRSNSALIFSFSSSTN